jgi:hypothetical protein
MFGTHSPRRLSWCSTCRMGIQQDSSARTIRIWWSSSYGPKCIYPYRSNVLRSWSLAARLARRCCRLSICRQEWSFTNAFMRLLAGCSVRNVSAKVLCTQFTHWNFDTLSREHDKLWTATLEDRLTLLNAARVACTGWPRHVPSAVSCSWRTEPFSPPPWPMLPLSGCMMHGAAAPM